MRQHILATALAAAVTALAYGQNLNPTVEVTNAYQGGASSIAKPAQQMAVPDSVTRFNLDFDYSVFEKPYRGAYEFTPYYVQLKPRPSLPPRRSSISAPAPASPCIRSWTSSGRRSRRRSTG